MTRLYFVVINLVLFVQCSNVAGNVLATLYKNYNFIRVIDITGITKIIFILIKICVCV